MLCTSQQTGIVTSLAWPSNSLELYNGPANLRDQWTLVSTVILAKTFCIRFDRNLRSTSVNYIQMKKSTILFTETGVAVTSNQLVNQVIVTKHLVIKPSFTSASSMPRDACLRFCYAVRFQWTKHLFTGNNACGSGSVSHSRAVNAKAVWKRWHVRRSEIQPFVSCSLYSYAISSVHWRVWEYFWPTSVFIPFAFPQRSAVETFTWRRSSAAVVR